MTRDHIRWLVELSVDFMVFSAFAAFGVAAGIGFAFIGFTLVSMVRL